MSLLALIPEITIFGIFGYNAVKTCFVDPFSSAYSNVETATKPVLSEQAQLIVELLRSDEGWTKDGSRTLAHQAGVRVICGSHLVGPYTREEALERVRISDESGDFCDAALNSKELKTIYAELKAYRTRQRDREQAELTRGLAQRILSSRDSVLGGSGVSADGATEVDTASERSETLRPDMLALDTKSGRIVQLGEGDSGQLALSADLRLRYELQDTEGRLATLAQLYTNLGRSKGESDDVNY